VRARKRQRHRQTDIEKQRETDRERERQGNTERVVAKFYQQTVNKELLMENCRIAVVAILYNFVKQKLLTDDQ